MKNTLTPRRQEALNWEISKQMSRLYDLGKAHEDEVFDDVHKGLLRVIIIAFSFGYALAKWGKENV